MVTEIQGKINSLIVGVEVSKFVTEEILQKFIRRVGQGNLTKEENPISHFCVYFAGYDPWQKQVFIGHHKKSNLWLFNGGHIDRNELPSGAIIREISEEWGEVVVEYIPDNPELLTITNIDNRPKQTCQEHFDLWFFVKLNKNNFKPDQSKLAEEFFENKWVTIDEANKLMSDKGNVVAIQYIKEMIY